MSIVVPNISSLKEIIRRVANHALQEDVAPEVQIMLAENAQKDVYDAYDPFEYPRSFSLTDGAPETYDIEEGDLKVTVSVNHPYGKLIEYGHGIDGMFYEFPFNRDDTADKFLRPRPFFRHTVEQFDKEKFKEVFKEGLEKRGFTIK